MRRAVGRRRTRRLLLLRSSVDVKTSPLADDVLYDVTGPGHVTEDGLDCSFSCRFYPLFTIVF